MSYVDYLGNDNAIPEGELRGVYKDLAAFLNQNVHLQRESNYKKLMDRILVQAYKSREAPATVKPVIVPITEIGPLATGTSDPSIARSFIPVSPIHTTASSAPFGAPTTTSDSASHIPPNSSVGSFVRPLRLATKLMVTVTPPSN